MDTLLNVSYIFCNTWQLNSLNNFQQRPIKSIQITVTRLPPIPFISCLLIVHTHLNDSLLWLERMDLVFYQINYHYNSYFHYFIIDVSVHASFDH